MVYAPPCAVYRVEHCQWKRGSVNHFGDEGGVEYKGRLACTRMYSVYYGREKTCTHENYVLEYAAIFQVSTESIESVRNAQLLRMFNTRSAETTQYRCAA